jgi:hypothetical protein
MDFFDRLFYDKQIKLVNYETFQPGILVINGTPKVVSRDEIELPTGSYIPFDIYDNDVLVGTYKLGRKIYKDVVSYPKSFYPEPDAEVVYFK